MQNKLKAIAMALPGLVALPAGAGFTGSGGGPAGIAPPWSYYSNATDGLTQAEYSGTVSITIDYRSFGTYLSGGSVTPDPSNGTAVNVTYYLESYVWDGSTIKAGESRLSVGGGPKAWGYVNQ